MINIKKYLPAGLSIIGAIGVPVTAVLSVNGYKKQLEKEKDFDISKGHGKELSKKDRLKALVPCYIPAAVSGLATMSSIIVGTVLSQKMVNSMAATAALAVEGWNRYREAVESEMTDEQKTNIVRKEAELEKEKIPEGENDGKVLYYEDHIGFFRAKPEDVAYAYADLNQILNIWDPYGITEFRERCGDFATYSDFLKLCGAEIDKMKLNALDNLGWSVEYLLEAWEYVWVHMHESPDEIIDGQNCHCLWFEEEAIFDPEDYYEKKAGGLTCEDICAEKDTSVT